MTKEIQQAIIDTDKVEKILLSCKSKDHLKVGYKLYQLWLKKYDFWLKQMKNSSFNYREGVLFGIIMSKYKDYNES